MSAQPGLLIFYSKQYGTSQQQGPEGEDERDLVEELAGHPDQKAAVSKYEYRGKPRAWTSDVWSEVYNLPKANPGGYVMKRKVHFTELQLLRIVKENRRQSKSGVFNKQVEGDSDFVLFCQMLNAILAPMRPEHFQHNLLAFYHYAWVAINDPAAPTPNWGDAVEKTMSKQIKTLGVYNEATCLGPYLAHLYSHFHEMDNEEKEDSKKRKALIQTISDFDTKAENEKELMEEIPHIAWEGEASGSKPLEQKTMMDYHDWGVRLESLGWETSKLFEAFHVEVGSVTTEAVARNMEQICCGNGYSALEGNGEEPDFVAHRGAKEQPGSN
ncbi:hypothetical protein R1flu_018291 [Riccia fluitans]|uniref:Uncharacterized protein n=1 Tax=Riccia fluitans TaxID=41844 RepID=A0ABD1ZFL0_9MARC